jgi:DNA-binding Lrp family transcriptional regulator
MATTPKQLYTGTFIPAHIMNDTELTSTGKILYAMIASFRDNCFASNAYLAKKVGITPRAVQQNLTTLENAGYIARTESGSDRILLALMDDPRNKLHGGGEIDFMGGTKPTSPNNKAKEKSTDFLSPTAPQHDFDEKSEGQQATPKSEIGFTHELERLCAALGVPKTRVTAGRVTKLKQRRKTYSFEEMLTAATVIGKDDYMVQGKYNNIDYLVRNDEKVDMWLQRAAPKAPAAAYTGPTSAPKKVWGDENVSQ